MGDCQWTRDGFALGTDKTLPELPRYRMETCDLVIDPVLPLDEGLYQCQVGGARGVAPVASEVAGMRLMEAGSTGSTMEMGTTWTICVWRTLRGTGAGPTTCTTCWPGCLTLACCKIALMT